MTIINGYATLAQFRAIVVPSGVASTTSDTRYEDVVEAASRGIDRWTGRRFYGAAETRYYSADEYNKLYIDDYTSINNLKTDTGGNGVYNITWTATTDYLTAPYNAILEGRPYTSLERSSIGGKEFPPRIRKGVLVDAVFGYISGTAANAPDPIYQVTLLVAQRILERKDIPFGIAGSTELGEQRVTVPDISKDAEISAMLKPYKRWMK